MGKPGKDDDRLPLRWGVILLAALGASLVAAATGGPIAGWGTALVTAAVLNKILGT